jgi:hypothetical protein
MPLLSQAIAIASSKVSATAAAMNLALDDWYWFPLPNVLVCLDGT